MKKNRKKIVYITGRFPHVSTTFTYKEVVHLKKNDLNIQVYSAKKPKITYLTPEMKRIIGETNYFPNLFSKDFWKAQLFFVTSIPLKYFHTMLIIVCGKYERYNNLKLKIRNFVNFIRGAYLAYKLKKEKNYIHLHAQFETMPTTLAFVASRLTGISYSFRSLTCFNPDLIYEKVKNALFIISSSYYDKNRLIDWTDNDFANKIRVNYLAVDLNEFEMKGAFEKESLIVSVGRLVEKKGFEYLIKASNLLKSRGIDFYIKIGGGGPLMEKLKMMIQDMGLENKIEILGYINHGEVKDLVKKAKIFCQPCVMAPNGDIDVFPVTLMEAMSLKKPVVSTKVSAIPEGITDGKDGILVNQKDPYELADALEKLLTDEKLCEKMGNDSRKKIKDNFNLNKNVQKLADIFRENINL